MRSQKLASSYVTALPHDLPEPTPSDQNGIAALATERRLHEHIVPVQGTRRGHNVINNFWGDLGLISKKDERAIGLRWQRLKASRQLGRLPLTVGRVEDHLLSMVAHRRHDPLGLVTNDENDAIEC
jgi:hypothetical protein